MEENKNITPGTQEQQQAQENVAQEQQAQTNTGTQPNSSTPPGEENKQESNTSTEDGTKKPEGQSKQEDSKFAKERHERDIKKAKAAGDAEGYKRARIKSVGGKNPYTDTPIETDDDFEFYELQDEVKANGGDPNKPYEVEQLRRKKLEEARKVAEENKTQQEKDEERANREVKEYLDEGHTQKELQEYWANPKFQEFSSDLLGLLPLKTIIAKFDKAYPKGNPQAKQEAANKISTPGSASSLEDQKPPKSFKDMSREEFEQFSKDVASGKIKIS